MKEVCDVGRWKQEEQSPSLPHEIIVDILSRLPMKDLLRFRVVCKQWEATISDPIFSEIHLQQQYKNPSSRNLIAWEDEMSENGLHVGELRNNCIEFVSAIEFGLGHGSYTLCSCDGLYLRYFPEEWSDQIRVTRSPDKCVLWNPSRRTYRELCCPVPVDGHKTTAPFQGMYHDPLMKDYKIVIADKKHYAVYSCRDNKWGDVKEMKILLEDISPYYGGFVNGSIYWLATDFDDDKYPESICFDCKDESFEILPLPYYEDLDDKIFNLTSFGSQLCLLVINSKSCRIEIMKKVSSGDEWMESKEECLCEYRSSGFRFPSPECQLSENEILLRDRRRIGETQCESFHMVYDKSKNTLVEIHNNHLPTFVIPRYSKYLENLLLL